MSESLGLAGASGFLQLGLTIGLVTIDGVRHWADRLIEATDVPDNWLLDLAAVKTRDDALRLLRHARVDADRELGTNVFLAVLRRQWLSHAMSLRQFNTFAVRVQSGWRFYDAGCDAWPLRLCDETRDELWDAVLMSCTCSHPESSVTEAFAPWAAYDRFIPNLGPLGYELNCEKWSTAAPRDAGWNDPCPFMPSQRDTLIAPGPFDVTGKRELLGERADFCLGCLALSPFQVFRFEPRRLPAGYPYLRRLKICRVCGQAEAVDAEVAFTILDGLDLDALRKATNPELTPWRIARIQEGIEVMLGSEGRSKHRLESLLRNQEEVLRAAGRFTVVEAALALLLLLGAGGVAFAFGWIAAVAALIAGVFVFRRVSRWLKNQRALPHTWPYVAEFLSRWGMSIRDIDRHLQESPNAFRRFRQHLAWFCTT